MKKEYGLSSIRGSYTAHFVLINLVFFPSYILIRYTSINSSQSKLNAVARFAFTPNLSCILVVCCFCLIRNEHSSNRVESSQDSSPLQDLGILNKLCKTSTCLRLYCQRKNKIYRVPVNKFETL